MLFAKSFINRVRTGPRKPGKSWNFKIQAWKSWKISFGHGKSWKIESLTLAKYFTYFQFTSHNN